MNKTVSIKKKEMDAVQEKIEKTQRELKKATKQPLSEPERIKELESQVREKEQENADFIKEIKNLKKL